MSHLGIPQQFLLDDKNAPAQTGHPKNPESGAPAGAGKTDPKHIETHRWKAQW